MATTDIQTVLSLDEYAEIMGLNPLNFNSAVSPAENLFGFERDKQPLWFKYSWQSSKQMSHQELATYIQQAELDIAEFLGYWPAPVWIAQETHSYTENVRRGDIFSMYPTKGVYKPFLTRYGKILGVGRRLATLISNETVAYSDEDTDTFEETATVTATTTITDPKRIKLFFAGKSGNPDYEIKPLKSVTISGGVATIVANSWLFFERDLYEALPSGEPITINGGDSANYVTTVDVYDEYYDTETASARFIWEERSTALGQTTQNAYLKLTDSELGVVEPVPALYDNGWQSTSFTNKWLPDMVQLWYRSGKQSQEYISGNSLSALSAEMKKNIAWLATSRMEITFKANNNVSAFVNRLTRVMSENVEGGGTFFLDQSSLTAPFGTKYGEVLVWRRLKTAERMMKVGLA